MATIAPAQPIAFRCSKCFQTRCSTVDCVGEKVNCELCGNSNVVPEATADRIAQGESFLLQFESGAVNQFKADDSAAPMTTAEVMKQCRRETIARSGPKGLVCSKTQRFLARMADSAIMTLTLIVSVILATVIAPPPAAGEPLDPIIAVVLLSLILVPPLTLLLAQMIMIAKGGRTLGKFCLNIKIVDTNGNPPGFLRGVVLRSFVNYVLCVIPFYGLVDAAFIFVNDSNRCVHDLLAGTHVIDAS